MKDKTRLEKIQSVDLGHMDRPLSKFSNIYKRVVLSVIAKRIRSISLASFLEKLESKRHLKISTLATFLKRILMRSVLIQYKKPKETSHHPNNLQNMDLSKITNAIKDME